MAPARSATPLLIVFIDLTGFHPLVLRSEDQDVADIIDLYYERVGAAVDAAGGRIVKFIGDAALITFPEDAVDRGVAMLLELKPAVDRFLAERGWDCRLGIKAHVGTVVAGPFGEAGAKRYDIIGKAVNTAAILQSTGVTLSAEAFRKLSPELRRSFVKHTPPITYIRAGDPRPSRKRG